ncbi:long-chain-fatty-acid--CoA ligase, putative [Entamoeba invadens IP1]|uniref:Long-chain-fatty-acid--CoA ligase, putative n=1 Tax=Entamoeba invadens IP1 TaxID=370355 RepID=A0A0A1U6V4_ENTIV|nr:long-chain-fatty-acid--CoA ligase, putative [Entamoeba invadens IP1]ELP90055.1 long-chain-fatty-acid--CoA ligase, putative [Entamoeba invadens IP1]|eukprot:XP_004256826.1 long-chain-fatty-acid--CoA ligase, putative [Entamoeba invadens IP1]
MSQQTFNKDHLSKKDGNLYITCKESGWNKDCVLTKEYFSTNTAYTLLKNRVEKYPNENLFGYRTKTDGKWSDYNWISSVVGLELVDALGSALVTKLNIKKGEKCGIMTHNRYEWFIAQHAMQRQGIVPIFLYPTLGLESLDYIVKLLNLKYLFCGTPAKTGVEIIGLNEKLGLITFDDTDDIPQTIKHYNYSELLNYGRENPVEPDLPTPDDIFTIVFTSGTSGTPKGVVHTFKSVGNAVYSFTTANCFDPVNCMLSKINYCYLPSAHVFDNEIVLSFVYGYGSVGFNSAGVTSVVDDLQKLHPTFLIAVPRVLQKIYDKFVETVSASCIANTLFHVAYHYKKNAVYNKSYTLINWDTLLFNKVKAMFGGKLEIILNGSAPLTSELYDWLRICTGAQIFQGYGLTESFGGFCTAAPGLHDDNQTSVGSPCLYVTMRLVSIPDMEYSVDSEMPAGEIQVKADQIFKEYYNDETQTKSVFTEDGYFCTGDIGRINADGSLSIVDRKKNLFKLAQGEYVAVEPLEYTYGLSHYVSQCFIYGESTDTFITAIVVPEIKDFAEFIKTKFNFEGTKEELQEFANTSAPREMFRQELEKHARSKGVPGYEVVRNIYVEMTPFSEENKMLTPSFKLRRPQIKKAYSEILKKIRNEVL